MNIRARAAVTITIALLTLPSLAFASFDQNLSVGAHGSSVISLQQFLISRNLLSSDSATGYFGSLTLSAVKAFQTQQNISPPSGFFGSSTRANANALASGNASVSTPPTTTNGDVSAHIASLRAQIQQLQAQITALSTVQPTSTPISCQYYTQPVCNGSLVSQGNDTNGCALPLKCVPTSTPISCQYYTQPVCNGSLVSQGNDTNGCALPLKCVPTSTASFSATPTSGTSPLMVRFTGNTTGTDYQINFGDGTSPYFQIATDCQGTAAYCGSLPLSVDSTHTYSTAGTFTATLTHYGATQSLGTATITVTGGTSQTFTGTPTSGAAPLTVTFSNVGSSIDYGDGSLGPVRNSGTVGQATHTYTSVGTYTATSDGFSVKISVTK